VGGLKEQEAAVAPTITGVTTTSQKDKISTAYAPFANVTITDSNSGAVETLTISKTGAAGTLSSTTLTGTASAVTTALRAVKFTPSANGTTTFTLSDKSSLYSTAVTNNQTTVITTADGKSRPIGLQSVAVLLAESFAVAPSASTISAMPNAASVSSGLSSPSPTFIGTPAAISLDAAATVVNYTLAPGSGIETIVNFQFGIDTLNIDLAGAAPSVLQVADTVVDGMHAISLYSSADPSHGIFLLGVPLDMRAENLLSGHTTISNGSAMIT
jgi:hypothetical protein